VEVETEVGKGTTFKVFLPAVPRVTETASARPVEHKVLTGSETVLVVEDEPTVQTLARLVLQQHGYKVLTAASGVEAMQVWQANSGAIDVLLTDVVMPDGKTGRELAQELRALRPQLRIICTSGYGRDATGMDTAFMRRTRIRFLQKPYRPQTLVQVIRESLDESE
jgi:CheY-like chemotaxis protein